jgi:hypothetical protein
LQVLTGAELFKAPEPRVSRIHGISMRRILLFMLLTGLASAQVKVVNPGFEQGELGGVPAGWAVPPAASAGFGVSS